MKKSSKFIDRTAQMSRSQGLYYGGVGKALWLPAFAARGFATAEQVAPRLAAGCFTQF